MRAGCWAWVGVSCMLIEEEIRDMKMEHEVETVKAWPPRGTLAQAVHTISWNPGGS